jgi:hypothetical protein
MEHGVDLSEPAQLDSRIDLSRGDRGVTEHLLNHSKVSATGQQMRGEAMPKRMRAHAFGQAGGPGMGLDDRPESDPR